MCKYVARLRFPVAYVFTLFVALCWTGGALAQTGPALLAKPWTDKNEVFDGRADAYFYEAGHAKGYDDSFRLDTYESQGRARLIPGNEISPRVGYNFLFLDAHTNAPRLHRQITDASIALGTGIAKWDTWVAGVTLGLGYAGTSAFGQSDAWYGKADLIVADQINATDYLAFILDYDGHRTFVPDIPLIGFGYTHRFDPKLQVVLGFPYDSISWKPIDKLDVELEYYLLTDFRANISYEFIRHWAVYGSFDSLSDAFKTDTLRGNRRLLFSQRRVELGIKFNPNERLSFKLAGGYEFQGGFRQGFDLRNAYSLVDFSDVPFVHGGVEFRF